MKPGDIIVDSDGDFGIVVRTESSRNITWVYYLCSDGLVSDDMDNLKVVTWQIYQVSLSK